MKNCIPRVPDVVFIREAREPETSRKTIEQESRKQLGGLLPVVKVPIVILFFRNGNYCL